MATQQTCTNKSVYQRYILKMADGEFRNGDTRYSGIQVINTER